ncbi:hypothetical protein ACFQ88_22800 [Paenibacillus sp. NPDC056579]|uniref:hypothetical protein n=1 Tax=Paenibacillus sp. NPDC056579 TaxID=3345871 RepID=UPI00369C6B25
MAKQITDVLIRTHKGYTVKKVSENMDKQISEFEEGFRDGVYAIPRAQKTPRMNIRAMYDYCCKKGIDPLEMTKEEKEQFLVK